jgi:hypothetical protein
MRYHSILLSWNKHFVRIIYNFLYMVQEKSPSNRSSSFRKKKWYFAFGFHKLSKCKKLWWELIAYFPLIQHVPYRKRLQKFFYFSVYSLPRVSPEPLPSNDKGYIYRQTDRREEFIKYAVEMGSGPMIYTPSFINIGSVIQNLIGVDTETHRQKGDLISLLPFFQNKESRLKNTFSCTRCCNT